MTDSTALSANRAHQLLASHPRPLVQPSILDCDFACLTDVLSDAEAAGVRMVHLDVMDGHFVPNLSYGPPLIRSIRKVTGMPFDAHLMISNPEKYIDDFCAAGCEIVTIHVEVAPDPRPLLARIHDHGVLAGIALNPPTAIESVAGVLDMVDLVLVMSVMPGFGGQSFQTGALDKFRWLRRHGPPALRLEADGGVNRDTIASLVQAGADLLVVGSALFKAPDFKTEYQLLQSLARGA